MKKLFLSLISMALAGSAYAQLNTFKEGDVISAKQMNENFQHLEQQFQGTLAKTINCADGEKIGDAISNGYTNITVSGTCTENLNFFEEWGDNTFALAPRYLKLTGADSTAKIVDATGGSESTIFVGAGTTLSIKNLTISGGSWGLGAYRNSNLLLSGVTIEGFTERGISVADSSYLGVNEGGVTISGGDGAVYGIYLNTGSSGWVHTSTVSNVETGINNWGQKLLLYNFAIDASKTGINLGDHSTIVRYLDGTGLIEGTSEQAINAWQGNFYSWSPGSLTIQNLQGGRGIDVGRGGNGKVHNLKMPDFNSVGTGWNPAISVGKNSSFELEGAEISGSTDENLIDVWDNSLLEIKNSIMAIGNASVGIGVSGNSRFRLRDSTVTGTVKDKLIANWDASSSEIQSSELTVSSTDIGIGTYGNSRLFLRSSKLTGTISNNLMNINDGSSAQISESELVAQSGEKGIDVLGNSMLKFENSSLEAVHHGLIVYRSSYAEVRKGASIKSFSGNAAQISLGSGLEIPEDASIVSTENAALNLNLSSWARINDGGNITIDGADSESDVYVSESSTLRVDNKNLIENIHCWNNGTVYASEGTVTNLSKSCTE